MCWLVPTSISSAKTGKVTPLGFWKVLEKRKEYRSKKYNNASMPFMQRIDEYGIALHGGVNPGFPASQGCVRMPMKFAEKLFGLRKLGTEVIIVQGKGIENFFFKKKKKKKKKKKGGGGGGGGGGGALLVRPIAVESATDEFWPPLLQERSDALAIIFGKAEPAHRVALMIELLVERMAPTRADHLLDGGKAERRKRGQFLGDRVHFRVERFIVDAFPDETPILRRLGGIAVRP